MKLNWDVKNNLLLSFMDVALIADDVPSNVVGTSKKTLIKSNMNNPWLLNFRIPISNPK